MTIQKIAPHGVTHPFGDHRSVNQAFPAAIDTAAEKRCCCRGGALQPHAGRRLRATTSRVSVRVAITVARVIYGWRGTAIKRNEY